MNRREELNWRVLIGATTLLLVALVTGCTSPNGVLSHINLSLFNLRGAVAENEGGPMSASVNAEGNGTVTIPVGQLTNLLRAVPAPAPAPVYAPEPAPVPTYRAVVPRAVYVAPARVFHVVVQGDNPTRIAHAAGLTLYQWRALNPGHSDALRIGESVRVR